MTAIPSLPILIFLRGTLRFVCCALLVCSLAGPTSRGFAQVIVSEFMADNESSLRDDTGQYSDWIEICNISATNVNLAGWGLTDKKGDSSPWLFPATNLAPNGVLVVFATDLNRRVTGAPLHTDFKLSAEGEYLGLLRPDRSVASEFDPFPSQLPNISYGSGRNTLPITLATTGSVGRLVVPTSGMIGSGWTAPAYNDSAWPRITNGVGFELPDPSTTDYSSDVLADAPLAYWRFNETGSSAMNEGTLGAAVNGTYMNEAANRQIGPRPPELNGFEADNFAVQVPQNGYVGMPYNAALNPAGPFTVEAWVKPDSSGSARAVISSQNRSGGGRSGYVIYQSTQWEFNVGNAGGYVAKVQAGYPTPGVWTHVVGVYDDSSASLYVNGELLGTVGLNGAFAPNSGRNLRIGQNTDGSGQFLGMIDEVSILNRALNATEVEQRFSRGKNSLYQYTGLIQSDIRSRMHNVNSTLYCRFPFVISNLAGLQGLSISIKYNDGFVAYLNGQPIASANAPEALSWDAAAITTRNPQASKQNEFFDLSGHLGALRMGTNILAFHGLNRHKTNTDYLLLPHVVLQPDGNWQTTRSYFPAPTPGAINGLGVAELGPILSEASHFPQLPGTNGNITVTCRVTPTFGDVANVTLYWRVMYRPQFAFTMYDDGLHGDGAAGDGVYGAHIPSMQGMTRSYSAGEMVRWYITASDGAGRASRLPFYFPGTATEEYLGTVIESGYVTSSIPVIHLFVQNYANGVGVDSSSKVGGPASVFYDGEFYDNVHMYVRGNSTVGYLKKSHSIAFNSAHKFRHPGPGGQRLGKTSFTADYPDPSYIRQRLTMWLCEQAGAPGPFYHPVRLQMNGQFYQLANHNDLHGEDLLARIGFDPAGALYNAAGTIVPSRFSSGGFDKKTRQWEGDADYLALAQAISESLPMSIRKINAFDILDLPQLISYMTVARFVHENDDVWANMSVYQDNDGDGLWRIIPFDMNLSWGAAYIDSPELTGLQITNDALKGHPLYGSSATPWEPGANWNRLYDVIFQMPETREMFLRHMRTFLDTWIKPQGDPASVIEPMVARWRDEIAVEAALDRVKWGWPGLGGQCNFSPGIELAQGVHLILNEFLPKRRQHFFGKHSVTNTALPIGITKVHNAGIPLSQPQGVFLSINGWDYNPASGNQAHEFVSILNTNSFPVDLTGWEVKGGIRYKFKSGTVIPTGGTLYLSPNVAAFRARPAAPRGGMGLFVQGDYSGQLSAWGDTFELMNETGGTVSTASYLGAPSLAQEYLRITEIMYNPAGAPAIHSDAQQFEYIELRNISTSVTLSLANVRFTQGITFNFSEGSILDLPPGGRVLVVRNAAAFSSLYGPGLPVAGQFIGALDSKGETVRLEDSVGEKILEFEYDNQWYPTTDGLGFSLVIVDENAHWSVWERREHWRPSGTLNGSPGAQDTEPARPQPVVINELLSHSDNGLVDLVELHNTSHTNVYIGGWLITDYLENPKKFRIADDTWLPPFGFVTFDANQFGQGGNGFGFSEYGDGVYVFEATPEGALSGFYHGFKFGAAPKTVPFGRHVTSDGVEHFVRQSGFTPMRTNAYPLTGPVVISELMYRPEGLREEFLELQNITDQPVSLFCTFTNEAGYGTSAATNTWRIRGGVDFDFPQNLVLAPRQFAIVTGFNPSTNAAQLATFRVDYDLPADVPVFGPFNGKLSNSGERIELEAPDKPDVTATEIIVPWVLQEAVDYRNEAPWPTEAGLAGNSLQRTTGRLFGNDPASWMSGSPSAGRPTAIEGPQIAGISVSNGQSVIRISCISGWMYTLEYKDELNASWTPVPPSITAADSELSFTNSAAAGQRFYRVRMD